MKVNFVVFFLLVLKVIGDYVISTVIKIVVSSMTPSIIISSALLTVERLLLVTIVPFGTKVDNQGSSNGNNRQSTKYYVDLLIS